MLSAEIPQSSESRFRNMLSGFPQVKNGNINLEVPLEMDVYAVRSEWLLFKRWLTESDGGPLPVLLVAISCFRDIKDKYITRERKCG